MKVSIITVCKNSEKTIERTIKSVLNQTYKNIEYIIIDGVSTDSTLDIISKYKDKIKLVSERDRGIYDAMNKGIRMSKGDIIGIINSDDWYEEDAVEKIVSKYDESNGKYQVIYGGIKVWDNDKLIKLCWNGSDNIPQENLMHPAMFVTKELYKMLGGFSLKYKIASDYDLQLRYFNSGKVTFVPIYDMIADFTLGGVSSQRAKTALECNEIKYKYGSITTGTYIKRKIIFNIQKIWNDISKRR